VTVIQDFNKDEVRDLLLTDKEIIEEANQEDILEQIHAAYKERIRARPYSLLEENMRNFNIEHKIIEEDHIALAKAKAKDSIEILNFGLETLECNDKFLKEIGITLGGLEADRMLNSLINIGIRDSEQKYNELRNSKDQDKHQLIETY